MLSTKLHPSRVFWSAVADLLGIDRSSDALPTKVMCPICGSRDLWIYQDCIDSGQWAHCFGMSCGFSGDMIELAAAASHASPHAAVRRLAMLGLPFEASEITPQSLEEYAVKYPGRRRRTWESWHRWRTILVNSRSAELAGLRAKFRLNCYVGPREWDRQLGLMLGAASAKEIEFFFRPYNNQGDHHVTQSTRKVFHGTCWRDVLLTTSYAAPGLLCGFHFLGRSGNREDRVFRQLQRDSGGSRRLEAGLAGLDAIERSRMFLTHVLAVDDPWLALRLQNRHYQSALNPLPIVAWHDHGRHLTCLAWRSLPERQVVLMCRQFDAASIYQASQCNGNLWLLPVRHGTKEYGTIIRDTMPYDLFRRAIRDSLPWREALLKWIPTQQPAVVEKLFLDLGGYPDIDAANLAYQCGLHDVKEVLDAVPTREVGMGSARIIERPEGWFMGQYGRRPEYLLSDAIVRIDTIIGGTDRPRYVGRILFGSETIPFDEVANEFDKKPHRTIIRLCLQAGVGRPRFRPRKQSLIDVAIAFHKPDVIKSVPAPALHREPTEPC